MVTVVGAAIGAPRLGGAALALAARRHGQPRHPAPRRIRPGGLFTDAHCLFIDNAAVAIKQADI